MKLTPIRVRGKRGQPKLLRGTPREAKRKRVSNSSSQLEAKRSKSHHAKCNDATRGMLMMSKAVPRILQLPQEVLERVFIASKNLSLPLANRELFRRLSTDSIKYQLVAAAFGPTWHAWYGLDNAIVHSYHGWNTDAGRIAGDAAFQSAILACSWAKLPTLLTSFDVWIRQHARGRTYFTVPKMSEARLHQAPEPGSLYDWAYNDINLKPYHAFRSPDMTLRQKFAFDFESFQAFIASQQNAAATEGEVYNPAQDYLRALLGMHLEVHPCAAIPIDLLSGPFEAEDDGSIAVGEEKAQRLFWLVRGGACLQEDQTWEATRDGFNAVLHLIKESAEEGFSAQDGEKRLALAMQLFSLFSLLGVFAIQWPKYVLQTNLGHVTAMVSKMPDNSAQRFELVEIASMLRAQSRANSRLERHGSRLQHYGSRWQLRVAQRVHAPHRGLQLLLFTNLCASRDDLFLRAWTTDGPLVCASAIEGQHTYAGDARGLLHEPWSDFGLD